MGPFLMAYFLLLHLNQSVDLIKREKAESNP